MVRAFTLIELLVVITIIVVLLALLTPALDKAIYQAELTMCAARQKAVSNAVVIYAGEHKRRYPYRQVPENAGVKSNHIFNNGRHDDRTLLRNYFGINATLNDPFTDEVDFDTSHPDSVVEVDYFMWFGWRWRDSPHAGRGMFKLGDRFTFNEDTGVNAGTHRFNLLISDHDVFSVPDNFAHASHPDREGKMTSISLQDGEAIGGVPVVVGNFFNAQLTMSRWQLDGDYRRGALDLNFALDDGSVVRHESIEIDANNDFRVFSDQGIEMIGTDVFNNNNFAPNANGYIPVAR